MFLLLIKAKNQKTPNQQNQKNLIKSKIEENLFPYPDKPQATLAS